MRPLPSPHLSGVTASAFADGQLRADGIDRAVAHLAACAGCRSMVESERSVRLTLRGAADVQPSDHLVNRLVAVPRVVGVPDGPTGSRSAGARKARLRVVAAGLTAGATATFAVLFVLGGPGAVGVSSGTATAVIAAVTAPDLARNEQGQAPSVALLWMETHGWVVPAEPPGVAVAEIGIEPDGSLVVEFTGPDVSVQIIERYGVLDPETVAHAEPLTIGDVEAFVVSAVPWKAVTQAGETVVTVVSHGSPSAGLDVLSTLPAAAPDVAPAARLARGWAVVANVLKP